MYYKFSEDMTETHPELVDRQFTWGQMKEVYRDLVDKVEYPDFKGWMTDMMKMDLVRQTRHFPIVTSEIQEEFEWDCSRFDFEPEDINVPQICGCYGRACRQMGEEANRFNCTSCALADFARG